MLLAIDAGNTNTVFAVFSNEGELLAQWRTSTTTGRTADEYVVWLAALMAIRNIAIADIDSCIISCVVPQSLFHFRNLSRRYFSTDPLVVGEGLDIGISVGIPNPREVGADRLVNAVGARVAYRGALLIVDSGTATTLDLVDEANVFQGGIIAPGINLSLQALHDAAAKLPRIAIERPGQIIGYDTVSAMQSGIFWGYVALIEGLIVRVKAEFGRPLTVVATGGVSSLFTGATDHIEYFDSDLTIRGLLEIFRRNRVRSGVGRQSA
jgi:type III pantothenate kinase